MKRSRQRRKVFIVLVVLMIFIGAGLLPPSRKLIIIPMGTAINRVLTLPVKQYEAVMSDMQNLREMYFANTHLEAQMQNYNLLKARLSDAQSESARLKTMIQFESKVGWPYFPLTSADEVPPHGIASLQLMWDGRMEFSRI